MNKLKTLWVFAILALSFASCEDDLTKATLNTTVASNELLATSASTYVLTLENAANTFETFKWTAPDFGFTASVTYKLQIDKASGNFSTALDLGTVSGKLELAVKVSDMNEKLLGLGLNPEEPTDVKLRVVSTVNEKVAPVYSSVKTIKVSAYATSFPPIYGMGAGLNGWGPWPAAAVEFQSSSFKLYETIAKLTTGEAFRFFAQQDWGPTSYNYPFFTSVSSVFVNANDGDSNLKVAGASGYYKITVDLKNKTVAAVAVAEPVLYMTGAALNGWSWDPGKPVKMTFLKPGVFEANATFTNGETFRFFAQADWGPTSYNYPYFTTVDSKFANANDGDKNLRFVGTTGPIKITVDLNAKTVVVGDAPKPKLYMTGAALNGWSWDAGKPVELTYISAGVYEATATFTQNEAFRFFAQADWGPTSYNYEYFTTVDAKFVNANDGDKNLKYVAATGSVTINVNLTTKVVSVK